jgi:hypothetical protein
LRVEDVCGKSLQCCCTTSVLANGSSAGVFPSLLSATLDSHMPNCLTSLCERDHWRARASARPVHFAPNTLLYKMPTSSFEPAFFAASLWCSAQQRRSAEPFFSPRQIPTVDSSHALFRCHEWLEGRTVCCGWRAIPERVAAAPLGRELSLTGILVFLERSQCCRLALHNTSSFPVGYALPLHYCHNSLAF